MTTRTQPIYSDLVGAVIERNHSRGIPSIPGTRDTCIKACLASVDYSVYFASRAASGFGLDYCLSADGENVMGLPGQKASRRGLELAAAVIADCHLRERGGGPEGGAPAWAGNIDDFLSPMPHLAQGNPGPNNDGGPMSAWPVEYRKAA